MITITGNQAIDKIIANWIKGTEDKITCAYEISNAQLRGTIPTVDSEGRYWSAEQIMEYGVMITRR